MKAFVIDDGTEADVLQAILSRDLSVQQLRFDLEREESESKRTAVIAALQTRLRVQEELIFNRPVSELLIK